MSEQTYNGFAYLEYVNMTLARHARRHRPWQEREQGAARLHPAVEAAVLVCKPVNAPGLVLEWPHIADTNKQMIAYTRDERSGAANRQVTTSVGKYLRRHFPEMSDHVLRDIVALHTPNDIQFKFLHTTAEIVAAVDKGPYSCMCSRYGDPDRFFNPKYVTEGHHPYEVYDPALGWHMAIVQENDDITGRALCIGKKFIRSYKKVSENGSTTDERLDAWLLERGYTKDRNWDYGTRFKYIPLQRRHFVAPYIDGYHGACVVIDRQQNNLCLVDSKGLSEGDVYYECRNTTGLPDAPTTVSSHRCESCDESCNEDDARYVGRYEDVCVCESCCNEHYVYAYSANGRERYIEPDDTVYVDGSYYDVSYLSDNGIVELADGDFAHQDDAVYIERHEEWYLVDDCVHCEHSGEYELERDCVQLYEGEWAHEDDAWCCDHSGNYYLNDEEGIRYETECGKTVHIDYADEYAPTTEGE